MTLYAIDERGLFCRHCGRSQIMHFYVPGVGFACAAQAIEARSGETEGLDPKGESAVAKPCAQGPAS